MPTEEYVHEKHEQDVALARAKKLQTIVGIFLVSSLLFVLIALGLTLHEGTARRADQNKARIERVAQINLGIYKNCIAIEKLKTAQRQDAIETYKNTNRTLRLIGIRRTAEIEARAREIRDSKLKRFKPQKCPPISIKS